MEVTAREKGKRPRSHDLGILPGHPSPGLVKAEIPAFSKARARVVQVIKQPV